MTLAFRSLRLKNFGPYFGEQHVQLGTPPEAPIVLIHGENTLGKTKLFAALRWCLYGTFQPQQSPAEALRVLSGLFNRIAEREGEHELEVAVELDAPEPYTLIRRAVKSGDQVRCSADLRIGPTVVPAADIEAEIGRLLHPQISEFFLFDAELLQRFYERLNTERERAFMRESIESVLGIPALQLAMRDVGDLAADAARRQEKVAKDKDEAQRLGTLLKQLSNQRSALETDKRDTQGRLRDAEAARVELREQLTAVAGLEADVRDQELLEARVADGNRESALLQGDLKRLLSDGWIAAAARPLQSRLADVQRSNSLAQSGRQKLQSAKLRVSMLEDRAEGGKCPTCRQPLPAPDELTKQELADARAELGALTRAGDDGEIDLATERRLTGLVDIRTAALFKEKWDKLNDVEMLQYERRRQLDAISDRLQGHRAADIRSLGQRLSRADQAINAANGALREMDEKLLKLGNDEQTTMRKLAKVAGTEPSVVIEATFFSFVRAVLSTTIDQYRERVRAEVEKVANEMFLRLIRDASGYGGVRILPDYRIDVLDRYNAPRDTSEGGRQLLALALIGALKRAAVRGGPVVLDSPLIRLDLEHRANVLKSWIPALGNQAVLLIQSGELTVEEGHKVLGAKIGREYQIVRPDGDPEHAVIERMH